MNWIPAELIVDQDQLIKALVNAGDYCPLKAEELYEFFKNCHEQAVSMEAPVRICTGQTAWSEAYLEGFQHAAWRCPEDWQ